MVPHALSRVGFLTLAVTLAGCAARYGFNSVEIAKTALLGMEEKDIRMCAGFPNRSFTEEGVTIWSYDGPSRSGGVNVSAPILFGAANTSLSLPGGGNCRVQMRFVDGRLDRLAYAGDNDGPRGRNTICTPVVDGCLDYARSYKKGRLYGETASGMRAADRDDHPDPAHTGGIRPASPTNPPPAAARAPVAPAVAPEDRTLEGRNHERDREDVSGN